MKIRKPANKVQDFLDAEPKQNSLATLSVRGAAFTLTSQAAQVLLGLGALALLARLLTPEDFGLIAMVLAVTGTLALVSEAGLSAATIQAERIQQQQISSLFWLNALIGLSLTGISVLLAPVVVWFFRDERLWAVTIVMSLTFLVNGLNVQHQALLRRRMRFGALAVISVVSQAFGFSVAIILALQGASYWSLVGAALATATTRLAATWLTVRWAPELTFRAESVRALIRFGGQLTGFDVLNYAAANLDKLLLGRFWGGAMLGLYTKSHDLLRMPTKHINTPAATVAVPALSRLQKQPDRYRAAYLRMVEKLAMLTVPVGVLMICASDWIVKLLLGSQWTEAGNLVCALGFAALLLPIANTSGWLFVSQGRSLDMLKWGLLDAAIKVVSIVAGLPWGAIGIAVALMMRTWLTFPLLWWFVGRSGPVRATDVYRSVAPTLIAASCGTIAALAFRQFLEPADPLVGLLAIVLLVAVVTLGVLGSIPGGRRALRDFQNLLGVLLEGTPLNARISRLHP